VSGQSKKAYVLLYWRCNRIKDMSAFGGEEGTFVSNVRFYWGYNGRMRLLIKGCFGRMSLVIGGISSLSGIAVIRLCPMVLGEKSTSVLRSSEGFLIRISGAEDCRFLLLGRTHRQMSHDIGGKNGRNRGSVVCLCPV
jgi:hypothetical protein